MREIKTIEVDRYEKLPDSRYTKQVGMITAQEAFDQLKKHLSGVGLLPDEYFIPSSLQNMSQELPDFRTAICHTDWGGSEGIYIDIFLEYSENRERKLFPFATGKTLDSSGDAFLRMSRIAAECSMMLNGRGFKVKVSERHYENEKEAEQAKPSLQAQIQSAEARTAAPDASVQVNLTKQELDMVKKSLDVLGDRIADHEGYSSGEAYWALKEKLEGVEANSLKQTSLSER